MKLVIRFLSFITLFLSFNVYSTVWEVGELSYPGGSTEISAFVDLQSNTQLQAVLCSKNTADSYRFTLLLPNKIESDSVIKVNVSTDDTQSEEYAEVSGNSLDLQVDENLLLSIPESAKLQLSFNSEDAAYLGIPKVLDINMKGADIALRNAAAQCTALCLINGFSCNKSLLSTLLWPLDNYKRDSTDSIDDLCTRPVRPDVYSFDLNKKCKLELDRFYKTEGIGALSFLNDLFNNKNGIYRKYRRSWDETSSHAHDVPKSVIMAYSKEEWYLILYSLVGNRHIREFPNSYYSIKNFDGDPTTLVYDIDNRYEMELLKYSSVLLRRMNTSINATNSVEKSMKLWSDFYRNLTLSLPTTQQAQAIRPIVYKTMLMRVWALAGKPTGIKFKSDNQFRQGSNGKTITGERLERECSIFEGTNGEQFFFASESCVKKIADNMRTSPLNTTLYKELEDKWDAFASAWMSSCFYNDSMDDAVGEHKKANLSLLLLSLFKEYGFGDYFQIRECLSSRDSDICSFESNKYLTTYNKEFNYRLDSISNVSAEDAQKLNELNNLYLEFYHTLDMYLDELVTLNHISLWRADFVKALSSIIQTNGILNFPYNREQLPDISLSQDEESNEDNMRIEQEKYED